MASRLIYYDDLHNEDDGHHVKLALIHTKIFKSFIIINICTYNWFVNYGHLSLMYPFRTFQYNFFMMYISKCLPSYNTI